MAEASTPQAIEYRGPTERDLDSVFELWWEMQSAHADYDPLWYGPRPRPECKPAWTDHFRGKLCDPNSLIFIASACGRPVGMILGLIVDRPALVTHFRVLAIENAIVTKASRRQGILRELMALITAEARARGARGIKLCVNSANPARQAYEKLGFTCHELDMIKYIG
jgi:ribosomal protein S18 acetylase RimI-like enzyme